LPDTGTPAPTASRKAGISYSALTFRDILRFVRRQYRIVAASVVLCLLLAVAATLVMRSVYQSDAVVVVKFGREFVYRSEVGDSTTAAVPTSANTEELLNTLVQLLQSRDIAKATLLEVGSETLYPDLRLSNGEIDEAKATERFIRSLSARPLRTSNVVQLSFQHPNPQLAQKTLTTMIQVFRDRSLSVYATSQTHFLKRQEELAQSRLDQAAGRLAQFRSQYGVLAFESGLPMLLQQRSDLTALVARGEADLAAATDQVTNLRQQAQNTPAEIVAHVDTEQSRVVDDARSKLLNLRLREQELVTQFADESPPLKQVRAEIKLAEQFLKQQSTEFAGTVRRARNQTLMSIEQELARAEAERAAVAARTGRLREEVGKLDTQLATYAKQDPERWSLERAVDMARAEVKQIATRVEQARLLDAANENRVSNISIIQTPSLPDLREPVRPRWPVNLALGLVAGLALGGLLAVLAELGVVAFGRLSFRRERTP